MKDNNSTERLMEQYYNEIYNFVYFSIKNKYDAEDIVQNVFIESYKKQNELLDHPFVKGWLYKTAKFKMLEYFNCERKIAIHQVELNENDIKTDDAAFDEGYPTISQVLNQDELQLLIDKHEIGLPVNLIANKNNLSDGAVRTRLSRIYKKVKSLCRF